MKQKHFFADGKTRYLSLLTVLTLLFSFAIPNAWAGDVTRVANIVSGSQYRIAHEVSDNFMVYPTTLNSTNEIGRYTETEAEGTIFTFTQENGLWYISFVVSGTTYYLKGGSSDNNGKGKVTTTTTKSGAGVTIVETPSPGFHISIGNTSGAYSTSNYYLRWNGSNKRFGVYQSNSNMSYVRLVDAVDCSDPATPLAVTSGASVTMGSTLSLTANTGNGGSKTWSVEAGTGSATIINGSTLNPVSPGTVKVKVHQNLNGTYCSQDAEKTVTINKRTATIVLSEAGAESTVAGTHYELDEYTLPTTAASCGTKVLVGWSTVTVDETNTKPASNYYKKGASVTLAPGENKFYAVYATATPNAGDWEKYTESTLAEGDYLFYAYDYVMNSTLNYNRLSSTYVTTSDNETIIAYDASLASTCLWHVAKSGNYYTISQGSNYVIGNGTNSQVDLSTSPTNNAEKFTVTHYATDPNVSAKTHTYAFVNAYNTAQSANANLKRGTAAVSGYFACYHATNTQTANVYLFKRGPAYSAYSTDCCEPPATALSITSANTVAMGNTITLSSTGGNGASITWTVTAGSGAGTITTGVFTPTSAGTVTIKAHQEQNTVSGTKYCAQDFEQEVTITVNTTGVEVDPTSKAIVVGETFTITPTVSPSDATDKTVSWSSSAEGKATVSSAGLVTGVAAGSATITCTTNNGSRTATCAVTVYGVTLQAKALVNENLVDIPGGNPGAPSRTGKNISPAANANNYVFDHWEISNATLGSSTTTKENTITNPTGAVTVTAVYLPGVEIKWYVNGKEWKAGDPDTSVESGTQYKDLKFPTDPTKGDACGDRFVGWTDHSMGAANSQPAPTPLLKSGNSDTTPITTTIEFHAVFADYNHAE